MKHPIKQKGVTKPPAVFHPGELVILAHYLGKRRLLPIELRKTTLPTPVAQDKVDRRRTGLALEVDINDQESEFTLSNAVARICLAGVQDELPQWAVSEGKTIKSARKVLPISQQALSNLASRFLFEINWADSGPGFSWPEQYWVTEVPLFKVQIVTASDDSPDAIGYCDFAIGWFNDPVELIQGVKQVICGHWHKRAKDEGQQWQEFLAGGLIGKSLAEAWAREAWGNRDKCG